ncbi:hypothetical protein VR7878_03669 [Vibrio ruber DSM 16370]|uniref:Uncharacterized protein n=1 Tax=Vibrio ruber (strain DSM 16370 / JCM 11486 / BCRC 17186 / CECT 7878 / LMG 23124 / VR1) TaxID=1123498 RepID=A0A1R4LT48_VIBR1|nr:hypothetical protein [Vibrio ruber]SJN59772.1 hypothetical protein VR7878_03669 [Vibrio ruber DSM 16370]
MLNHSQWIDFAPLVQDSSLIFMNTVQYIHGLVIPNNNKDLELGLVLNLGAGGWEGKTCNAGVWG